jgi:hypothetical protein
MLYGTDDAMQGKKRAKHGRYILNDAAMTLAQTSGWDVKRWLKTIVDAILSGELPVRNPKDIDDPLPYTPTRIIGYDYPIRDYYEQTSAGDLNAWIGKHPEWGVGFRFDDPAIDSAKATRGDGADAVHGGPIEPNSEGLTKREKQIRAIEAMVDELGYKRLEIPDGGKSALRKTCKERHPNLFGAGDSPFNDAWKEASPSRLRMRNRSRYFSRS